jgi:hypothetical protein
VFYFYCEHLVLRLKLKLFGDLNMTSLEKAIETRMNDMKNRREKLVESWNPYISAVQDYVKDKRGRGMSDWEKMNIAQCLENALVAGGVRAGSQIFETTTQSNIAFLGIQLPVIAALLPSLVLNEIGMVQALDRRQGAVFYMNLKYGTTKGNITSGSTMADAQTGHNQTQPGRRYAMNYITAEPQGTGTGDRKSVV